jgi:hypothetical protein
MKRAIDGKTEKDAPRHQRARPAQCHAHTCKTKTSKKYSAMHTHAKQKQVKNMTWQGIEPAARWSPHPPRRPSQSAVGLFLI